MFFVTGAVGFVAAGFFENLFNLEFLGEWSIILLFLSCVLILSIGRFNLLDNLIKIIVTVLVVSTVLAFLLTVINGPVEPVEDFIPKELWTTTGIFFLLALMGWMPTACLLYTSPSPRDLSTSRLPSPVEKNFFF